VRNAGRDSDGTVVNIIVHIPVSNNIAELPGLVLGRLNWPEKAKVNSSLGVLFDYSSATAQ